MSDGSPLFLQGKSEQLVAWVQNVVAEATSEHEAAQQIVRKLGVIVQADGTVQVGFWIPHLIERNIGNVFLEILRAQSEIDFSAEPATTQTIPLQRTRLPLTISGDYAWGVYDGLIAGTRTQAGDFYWLAYQDANSQWQHVHDHLANSLPFGAFAPAELYDMAQMHSERADLDYFTQLQGEIESDGILRLDGPVNMLQIHPTTSSAEGTLAGLTRIYSDIAHKIEAERPLTPAEQNYIGYDAIQLMPIEPTIEVAADPPFWQSVAEDDDTITVSATKPYQTNWGYDVLVSGSPAVNACVLGSGRPDEFVDLIATLHTFPIKPIKIILDVVYGHTDNQAIPLLNPKFLAGANMYGQNLDYTNPVTRAYLLEMQRRKSNFGVDGMRVDGAQDFKIWIPETDELVHDDDYLKLMNDVVQEVNGQQYRLWMIFEDGRPWPRDDWELASSYLEVTRQFPNVIQWGPLTFAHNTPFLFTFWISKWWRIKEIAEVGAAWITGCANHDTLRRGTQVSTDARVNSYLGDTLPEIYQNAYDNVAATLFTYAFSPGIPMDFINALHRAPWGFIRNTDDHWGVKIVSEESRFLYWIMTDELWAKADTFPRLKEMGFMTLEHLRRFMIMLDNAVQATDYDLEAIASIMQVTGLYVGCTVDDLKQVARAWMDDNHEFCNVSRYENRLKQQQTGYNLALRDFRRAHSWLKENLRDDDHFAYRHPVDGSMILYGLRHAPDGEQLLFIANMEGAPDTLTPIDLPIEGLAQDGWRVLLQTPELIKVEATKPLTLRDSEGVVFGRKPPHRNQAKAFAQAIPNPAFAEADLMQPTLKVELPKGEHDDRANG